MSRIRYLNSVLLLVTSLACAAEQTPITAPGGIAAPSRARDARTAVNPLPVWTVDDAGSHNFVSDGRGDYVVGTCGLDGAIFYSNYDPSTGVGGDATIDNSAGGTRTCAARKITVNFDGLARNVTFFNVHQVVGLAIGANRLQDFVIDVAGDKTCTRIGWKNASEGGAGGQMLVTRTSSSTWTGQTSGGARCMYFQGATRIWTKDANVQVTLALRQP
jgi:hypothetical protein